MGHDTRCAMWNQNVLLHGLEPESDANASGNATAARIGAAKLRKQLIDDGYGPAVESLARKLVDRPTKRET